MSSSAVIPLRPYPSLRGSALPLPTVGRSSGEVIPQGAGHSLRVVNVIEPERDDRLPVLVAELAEN